MKNVALKTATMSMTSEGKPIELVYKLQLEAIFRQPAGDRVDYEEMRRSIRILDALEVCTGDVLQLENADFEYLQRRVKIQRWPIIDKAIIQFVDDVTKEPEV